MLPDLAVRIDEWANLNGKDSHSEAMRHLLEIGLIAPTLQSAHAPVAPVPRSRAAINHLDHAVERSGAMQGSGRASNEDESDIHDGAIPKTAQTWGGVDGALPRLCCRNLNG